MPRPLAPRLQTERLVLDAWADADASWYGDLVAERSAAAAARGEAATPRTSGRPGREARLASIATLQDTAARSGIPLYPVRRIHEQDTIGYCGLVVGRSTADEPELAYELFERVHGHGYATEAAAAVVDAARAAGYERLWATIREWNTTSFRVVEKLGFVRTDRPEPDDGRGRMIWTRLDL
ncbi:GNAT family N-acetyltransferase [Curtobacterium sp. RRHDQ10]|uniref:GNAT family N-acetyltransferase n=1 Tax=Curtobacterium phyllosphaerae TaxID=3413379 RepID=UPI003BF173C6